MMKILCEHIEKSSTSIKKKIQITFNGIKVFLFRDTLLLIILINSEAYENVHVTNLYCLKHLSLYPEDAFFSKMRSK